MLVKQSPVKMFMFLIRWLCFLNPYQVYAFPVVMFLTSGKRIRMIRLDSCEWLGVWDSMGRCLEQWAPMVSLKLTPE